MLHFMENRINRLRAGAPPKGVGRKISRGLNGKKDGKIEKKTNIALLSLF